MKNKKTLSILLALALGFSAAGCGAASGRSAEALLTADTAALSGDTASAAVDELFTARDLSGEGDDYVTITLSGSGASCEDAGVTITDGLVTITAAGNYLLTGDYAGRILVDAAEDAKVQLILSDAAITSEGASAICVTAADKLFVTLAEGTENRIEAAGELAELGETKADGAIYAKCDLTVNGTGALEVVCESGHGVVSKDDLKIASGTLTVKAAKQALSGKDSVSIADGTITLESGTDAIHSENTDKSDKGTVNLLGGSLKVSAGSDGVDATGDVKVSGGEIVLSCGDDGIHADATLTVSGGSLTVSRSYEGLEAADIVIAGGEIDVTASDDGLNAAGGADGSGWGGRGGDPFAAQDVSIMISGGTLRVNASGDGIDSNGDLTVSGGVIYVSGPTNAGNGALDYNGKGVISGGTLIAASAMGMAENFGSESSQCSVCVNFAGTLAGGSEIRVCDASGRELASFTPEKNYQCAVISLPELTVGESYTVSAGGSEQSITLSSVITGGQNGFGGGQGGFGGGRGGFGGGQGGFGGGQNGFGSEGMTPPEDFDGTLPEGFDGTPPEGFDGTLPEGFDGTLPEGFGGRPGGFGGEDGEGRGGRRPGGRGSADREGTLDATTSATPASDRTV